ncbi:uncharacterized protein LOC124358099 [Homalodisca vitripennis]|uniref:uncharacterized protein LOC124358099 n=1 Tax=Homalodisca vitripennis TaxID=197043 RepID=UPI001EE9C934|nr:uncharacterized protein LOC124358099 [Homalodisca vitripennis]
MSPEVDQLTPEIFSNFFASSVEEVRSSTGSSVTTAMLYLPRTVSANFKLKKVSCDESQFGFRGGLSTVDAVGGLMEAVLGGFENRAGTVATMCDLTKAFDCVPHDILLMKLEHYGVDGAELNLFRSYIKNRTQQEMIGENSSLQFYFQMEKNQNGNTEETLEEDDDGELEENIEDENLEVV